MASIGSFPFIDMKTERSVLLHCGNHRRSKIHFLASRPRKLVECSGLNEFTCGNSRDVEETFARFSLCCERVVCKGWPWRTRRTTGLQSLGAKSKDYVEGEDRDEFEDDALQATIEKSKKVLAMQRNLLQQVYSCILFYF